MLEFDCNTYSITGSGGTRSIENSAVFSPGIIRNGMLSYSRDWKIPYSGSWFSYLTSPDIAYLILGNSEEAAELFEMMPENLNKEHIQEYSDFDNSNYYKVRYITFGDIPPVAELGNLGGVKDTDVSLLKITVMDGFPGLGKIAYYTKQGNSFVLQKETYFNDASSLIGAIYSEDADTYECNMRKALQRAAVISDVLKDKMLDISGDFPVCPYDVSVSLLGGMTEALQAIQVSEEGMIHIHTLGKEVERENLLLKTLSCPQVY